MSPIVPISRYRHFRGWDVRLFKKWIPVSLILGSLILSFQNCSRVDFQAEDEFYRSQNLLVDEHGRPIPYYSNFNIGDPNIEYPPLKMMFVLDNSSWMLQGQPLVKGFQNLFSPQNRSLLDPYDLTIYVTTTSQLNGLNTVGVGSSLFQSLPVWGVQDLMGMTYSALDGHRRPTLTGAIPGDVLSYSMKTKSASNGYKSYIFEETPVLGINSDSNGNPVINIGMRKAPNQDPQQLMVDFQNRISLMNAQYNAAFSSIVSKQSGLCAVSRMLKNSSKYFQEGELLWMSVFSNKDEAIGNEQECVDQIVQSSEPIKDILCEKPLTDIQWPFRKPSCTVKYTTPTKNSCLLSFHQDTYTCRVDYAKSFDFSISGTIQRRYIPVLIIGGQTNGIPYVQLNTDNTISTNQQAYGSIQAVDTNNFSNADCVNEIMKQVPSNAANFAAVQTEVQAEVGSGVLLCSSVQLTQNYVGNMTFTEYENVYGGTYSDITSKTLNTDYIDSGIAARLLSKIQSINQAQGVSFPVGISFAANKFRVNSYQKVIGEDINQWSSNPLFKTSTDCTNYIQSHLPAYSNIAFSRVGRDYVDVAIVQPSALDPANCANSANWLGWIYWSAGSRGKDYPSNLQSSRFGVQQGWSSSTNLGYSSTFLPEHCDISNATGVAKAIALMGGSGYVDHVDSMTYQQFNPNDDGSTSLKSQLNIPGGVSCDQPWDGSNGFFDTQGKTVRKYLSDNFGGQDKTCTVTGSTPCTDRASLVGCVQNLHPSQQYVVGIAQSQLPTSTADLDNLCRTSLADNSYRYVSQKPSSVVGCAGANCTSSPVTGIDSQNKAIDFNTYIQKQAGNIFGNSLAPIAAVFTANSGGKYSTFANNFGGKTYSINQADYSIVLASIRDAVRTKMNLTAKIKLIDPRQQIRRVWITKPGQPEYELPSTEWGSKGSSLNIKSTSGVEYGDGVRVEFW